MQPPMPPESPLTFCSNKLLSQRIFCKQTFGRLHYLERQKFYLPSNSFSRMIGFSTENIKPRSNNHNMYANIVGHNMLRAFGYPVATCCDMLGVLHSSLKRLNLTEPATPKNSKLGGQTHATCRVPQCRDVLRRHVAIVWRGLMFSGVKPIIRSVRTIEKASGRQVSFFPTRPRSSPASLKLATSACAVNRVALSREDNTCVLIGWSVFTSLVEKSPVNFGSMQMRKVVFNGETNKPGEKILERTFRFCFYRCAIRAELSRAITTYSQSWQFNHNFSIPFYCAFVSIAPETVHLSFSKLSIIYKPQQSTHCSLCCSCA